MIDSTMIRSSPRGEMAQEIRSPTGADFREQHDSLVTEVKVPIKNVDESIRLDWNEIFSRIVEEQEEMRRREIARDALNNHPEENIIVVDEATGEIITTADSSQDLAESLSEIDYDPKKALIVRRDEWES